MSLELYPIKLKAGRHFGPDFTQPPDENGKYPTKMFERGDVFYDKTDLTLKEPDRYDVPTGPRTRETVQVGAGTNGSLPAPPAPKEKAQMGLGQKLSAEDEASLREMLNEMDVSGLRDYARSNGIQLHGAKSKADLVDAILRGDSDGDDGK